MLSLLHVLYTCNFCDSLHVKVEILLWEGRRFNFWNVVLSGVSIYNNSLCFKLLADYGTKLHPFK